MPLGASNLAYAVGASAANTQFQANASVLPRIVAVFAPVAAATITANGITVNKPVLITNPSVGIANYGGGGPMARLISQVFAGSNGSVRVWAIPETEGSAAATNASAVTITASTPAVGTVALYINGIQYTAATTATSTATTIASALNTLINADANCPVTSSPTAGVLALTAKVKGPYGNFITLGSCSQPGDQLPVGVTVTLLALTGGTVTSTVATDLVAALGTGSQANILPDGTQVTDIVHGWGQDQTSLAAFSTYNGVGNTVGGLYDDMVGRPIRVLTGDVLATGAAALTAVLAIGTTNITDRTNGLIAVPGSLTHPNEIAAVAIGVMAATNNKRAEQNYVGLILPGVDPGYACALAGNCWTDQYYTGRDTAVQGGISPTVRQGSSVLLQNVVTFYHPASVPVTSNIYREMVNISKLQNILASIKSNFSGPKWLGYTIVSDAKNVTASASRPNVRDLDSIKDDYIALAKSWAANAWTYSPDFTIKAINNPANLAIQLRTGGDGWTANIPVILSGVGNVAATSLLADISLAVLLN